MARSPRAEGGRPARRAVAGASEGLCHSSSSLWPTGPRLPGAAAREVEAIWECREVKEGHAGHEKDSEFATCVPGIHAVEF